MGTTKGLSFVLSVAVGPPAICALLVASGLQQWRELLRPLILLVLLPWLWALRNITYPYLTSPLRDLPYPPNAQEEFFGGHMTAVNEMPRGHNLRKWIDTVPNNGLIQWRGPFHGFPTVMLTTIEGLQEALITHPYDFEKVSWDRIFLEKFLGRGLIVVEGTEHKWQRKHLQPAFAGSQIKGLIPLFWSKAGEFVDVMANELHLPESEASKKSGVIEIDAFASRVTVDIIGMACLGRDLNAIHNSGDKIVEQYDKILTPTDGSKVLLLLCTILLPVQIARRLPFLRDVRDAADGRYNLRLLCRQLMEAKRRDMETQNEKHIDIISTLIRSGNFDDDQLVDQILTFLAAGHETTSNALVWTSYLLASHPEKQSRLRDELTSRFGPSAPQEISDADLDSLPYLEAVVSEQMRLWPVVPLTGREAARDTTLLGQVIPKGTMVVMCPWAINRSEKFWGKSASSFQPERWLDENGSELPSPKRSPLTMLTFLHGPRSCIGQAFSRAELKCLVIRFVMRFSLELANPDEAGEIETGGLITIKPKHGLKLRLTEL